jgi:hypothetical protein
VEYQKFIEIDHADCYKLDSVQAARHWARRVSLTGTIAARQGFSQAIRHGPIYGPAIYKGRLNSRKLACGNRWALPVSPPWPVSRETSGSGRPRAGVSVIETSACMTNWISRASAGLPSDEYFSEEKRRA